MSLLMSIDRNIINAQLSLTNGFTFQSLLHIEIYCALIVSRKWKIQKL